MLEALSAIALGWVAGAINSMAGGATLLTFPALIWLGLDPKAANVTNTVGLFPGSIGGAVGYRKELKRSRTGVWSFLATSLLGGAVGAWLLVTTDNSTFRLLVPWLILGATALFALQKPIARWLKLSPSADGANRQSGLAVLVFQFLVAVYGGYFGAGIGVLMLAGLGFLGIDDLHERNGIKNIAATCINGIAAILFAAGGAFGLHGMEGAVHWPLAAFMALGAIGGGFWSAGLAKRVGPAAVRAVVILVGIASGIWALFGGP